MARNKPTEPGDIVQVLPGRNWGGCLVIVTEVRSWGVQGFTPMPPHGGQAYVRIVMSDFEHTGGKVIFAPEGSPDV
jgi:hypothetical protein